MVTLQTIFYVIAIIFMVMSIIVSVVFIVLGIRIAKNIQDFRKKIASRQIFSVVGLGISSWLINRLRKIFKK